MKHHELNYRWGFIAIAALLLGLLLNALAPTPASLAPVSITEVHR